MRDTTNLNIRKFPNHLLTTLKIQATLRGLTLKDFVIKILGDATKRGEQGRST